MVDVGAVVDHAILVVIMIILAQFLGEPAFGSPKYMLLKEQWELLPHKGIYYVIFDVSLFVLFVFLLCLRCFFFCCFFVFG